jgi:polymorphic toxin system DSP-PTPase phosphatase-like protein
VTFPDSPSCRCLGRFARPELVGEGPPGVAQIGAAGDALELPVGAHESAEIGLEPLATTLLEHADVPGALVDAELGRECEGPVSELGRCLEVRHATAIGTGSASDETLPPDGVATPMQTSSMRPPTVIEEGRVIAGRHPCAWGPDNARLEVEELLEAGVTLFLDLTQSGELDPYSSLVVPPARYVNRPIRDFSTPSGDELVAILDEIDVELDAGGLVYVHCWAGCGRTGVVVGSWLVRHGADPNHALRRIAETRGLGCPQTLEQRLVVLAWEDGR